MKLLLYTPCYPPDTAAYSHLIENLAVDLVSAGHQVTVISSTTYAKPHAIGWKLCHRERHNGVDLWRVNTFPSPRKGLVRKAIGFALFSILALLLGLFLPSPDVIFAASTPPTMGIVGGLVAKVRRSLFVYNVQDIFPDVAIKLNILKSRPLIQVALWMEQLSYWLSDKVTVIGGSFAEVLGKKGVPSRKLEVIPNWIDTDAMTPPPRERNGFIEEHGLQGRFVVLYAGNFGLSQGLETVVDAAKQLEDCPSVQFLLIGDGERRAQLEEFVRVSGTRNVRVLPFQPRERLPELFAAGDVGIVPLKQGLSSDSIPSKTLTMMAAALPIIASIDPECALAQFLRQTGTGVVVEPESPSLLSSQIRELHLDPERVKNMGETARHYTVDYLSRKQLTARYLRLFEELVRGA